eukprot:TRINITY_DN3613_c0_g2_i1.p2 TRINITY_DN3613_c0_g2~~TRINITY_DN3613_c0_g2_i1.p2  ORF type:complete len:194 (-),score=64.26 TRINITY_DN3613_c0_g2_i1:48-629(-)
MRSHLCCNKQYFNDQSKEICVTESEDDYGILGDPFFRAVLVVHDLTKSDAPKMGFGQLSSSFTPSSNGIVLQKEREPITVESEQSLFVQQEGAMIKAADETRKVTSTDRLRYYTTVGVGTPAQTRTVQIDTGSTWFAVISEEPVDGGAIAAGILIPLIILGSAAGVFWMKKEGKACFAGKGGGDDAYAYRGAI